MLRTTPAGRAVTCLRSSKKSCRRQKSSRRTNPAMRCLTTEELPKLDNISVMNDFDILFF